MTKFAIYTTDHYPQDVEVTADNGDEFAFEKFDGGVRITIYCDTRQTVTFSNEQFAQFKHFFA